MSQRQRHRYRFGDELPLNPIEAGTALLLAGPTMSGARELALRLVLAGSDYDEGMAIVSTATGGERVLDDCERMHPGVHRSLLGVVDCTTGPRDARERFSRRHTTVSGPSDLTGISIELSLLYEAFRQDEITGIRAVIDSVSMLLTNTPVRTVCRFLHTLTGRLVALDGLGAFLIDPSTHDERVVSTVGHYCDGRLDMRAADDGTTEIRVRGLPDQPRTWTPISLDR